MNKKPRIFIGSSVEGLSVAYAIQQNLTHDAEATVWDQGVFELSKTSIESLTDVLDKVDFGVFVFSPDDITHMRGQNTPSVRDNVMFEFGLFVGKLTRQRVFFVIPEGEEVKMPTDMLGITPGKYDPNRQDKSYQAATGAACNQIRIQIRKLSFIAPLEDDLPAEKEDGSKNSSENIWFFHYMHNDYQKAKEELENLLLQKAGEEGLEDQAWLAYIDLKMDEKSGVQRLIELSEQHKDKVDIQSLVANMFLWENYVERAISLTDAALSNFPGNIKLLKLKSECLNSVGDTTGAKSILNDSSPKDNPEIAIELSLLYENEENIDKAINVIHSAYLNFPNNNDLLFRYSHLLTECQRHKEALYMLNTLTLKEPKSVQYWGNLSNCCLILDLYDQAMIACRKAEELSEGKESWILSNIGNMLNNKGLYTDAMSFLNKSLLVDPSSQYAHDRLAKAINNKDEENKKFTQICQEGKKLIREYKAPERDGV